MARLFGRKFTQQRSVRVCFEILDAGSLAYYANYLNNAERARTKIFEVNVVKSSTLICSLANPSALLALRMLH